MQFDMTETALNKVPKLASFLENQIFRALMANICT